MIIDGHAHTSGDFYNGDKLVRILDMLGVDKVVLCPGLINGPAHHVQPYLCHRIKTRDVMFSVNHIIRLIARMCETSVNLDAGNEYVYKLRQKYPERIIQFYWADTTAGNVMKKLDSKYNEYGFSGIKLHQCIDSFCCDSDVIYSISEFARQKDIPIFIHLFSKEEVLKFIELADDNPLTRYIVGHLIGFEFFRENGRKLDNISFDISPIQLVSDYRIYNAINSFGAERLVFGSDEPYGRDNLLNNLKRVKQLDITDTEKELILGKNMQRLLRM